MSPCQGGDGPAMATQTQPGFGGALWGAALVPQGMEMGFPGLDGCGGQLVLLIPKSLRASSSPTHHCLHHREPSSFLLQPPPRLRLSLHPHKSLPPRRAKLPLGCCTVRVLPIPRELVGGTGTAPQPFTSHLAEKGGHLGAGYEVGSEGVPREAAPAPGQLVLWLLLQSNGRIEK